MKKAILLIIPFILVVAFGCSKNAETENASTSTPVEGPGKDGQKTQGMSADQVGVTDAGKNADASTGSALGNK